MWYIERVDNSQLQDVAQIIQDAYLSQLEKLKITREIWPDYVAFKTSEMLEEEAGREKNFYVLFEDNKPVGTVCIDHSLSVFQKGYVRWLAVISEVREKGFGTKLMDFAEEQLFEKGANCIEVSIIKGDREAEEFAIHRGYKVTHQVSAVQLPYDITYLQLKKKNFISSQVSNDMSIKEKN